jgi:hypothetical protein
VKDETVSQLRDKLKSLNKPDQKINDFIERMKRYIAISDASAPANISRNVPIKHGSDTANHLDAIIKSSKRFKKDLALLEDDSELRARLNLPLDTSQLVELIGAVENIYETSLTVKKYQSAMGSSEYGGPPHLRPEYKGKNPTSHRDVEYLVLLNAALREYFPEIKPAKNQKSSEQFPQLAVILIGGTDRSRAINKFLEATSPDV